MKARLPLAAAAAIAAVFSLPAGLAASPPEGRVSLGSPAVTWTGSFTGAANTTAAVIGPGGCTDPRTGKPHETSVTSGPVACDVYALSVEIPKFYWSWPRDGGMSVVLDDFGDGNDVDVAVHRRNPDGTVGPRVGGSASDSPSEKAIVKEASGEYYVFAIGHSVANAEYKGTATLFTVTGPVEGTVGRVFEPQPLSLDLYDIKPPGDDPARQRHVVEAADRADLFVETWLPKPKDGRVPPAKIPTILVMTPYVSQGVEEYANAIRYFVARGFAVSQHNVRGSGESGGCLEQTGPRQIDDGARVVEYLGRDAPWSNGNVGMYGISYDAETQISVAGLGDPEKTRYLKAIVPAASVGGQYEYSYFDGVPYAGYGLQSNAFYLGLVSAFPGANPTAEQYRQKMECQPEVIGASIDQSGDLTPYYQDRELRLGAPKIRAATFMVHGLSDFNVLPITAAGFFERLPASTPHKGLFGIWRHAFPDRHSLRPEWNRGDWLPMALAWYDRYLKDLHTGVEDWPTVQVQGNDGQWRAEQDWPTTGGPVGHLALGSNGALGVATPEGSTGYLEQGDKVPGSGRAVFETGPLAERLEITGQPVLDAWISLDQPDAHIVAIVETFDADGEPIVAGTDFGMRSARHLDPLVENRFAQTQGKPAPTNTPIRVPIRFLPTDLVVPKGGNLRLTVSGANWLRDEPTPSGSPTQVTVLHDCEHPSALRFLMPRADPDLLRVRDARPAKKPVASPRAPISDAGGAATRPVCGMAPVRLSMFGPVIEAQAGDTKPPAPKAPKTRVLGRALPATGVESLPVGATLFGAAIAIAMRMRSPAGRRGARSFGRHRLP